jgi:hypothetical protein
VIKRGTGPAGGVVTLGAGLGEAGLHMIGIRGAVEIGLVARVARRVIG